MGGEGRGPSRARCKLRRERARGRGSVSGIEPWSFGAERANVQKGSVIMNVGVEEALCSELSLELEIY